MTAEKKKNIFQVVMYFGTAITIIGSLLSIIIATIIGSIILLIGTIFFDIYSSKIEEQNRIDFDKKLAIRDETIKKNAEQVIITSRFHAEVDNPIKSIYFILDLGSTRLESNFKDYSCVIYFVGLDITIQFKTLKIDYHAPSENIVITETRVVKGKDLNNSPFIHSENASFKRMSEFYLDLRIILSVLPKGFTLRNLGNQYFYFYLTGKQTILVKGIKLNVNNWNVFKKDGNKIKWRKLKQDWLPNEYDFMLFHQEYQTKFIDSNIIRFFDEGFSRYEITQSNIDERNSMNKSDIKSILSKIDDSVGTFALEVDDKWLVKNNAIIEYLPLLSKDSFSIRIFRDTDNILKVSLSYKYSKYLVLKCKYPENFADLRKNHTLIITWGKNEATFYINGIEVDKVTV